MQISIAIYALFAFSFIGLQYQQLSFGQATEKSTRGEQTLRSAFDTFVTSEPQGYGVYEERESNVFEPGETFLLYVEPEGYSYGNVTDEDGSQLYTMNFTIDFTASTKNGRVLGGQEGLLVSNLVSHHQNKELFFDLSISQSSSFPPGDYVLTYRITDENSGKSFDIRKDVTVQAFNIEVDNNITNARTQTTTATEISNNNISNFLTWENPLYEIKIQYPSSWEKQEEEELLVSFLSPPKSPADRFPELLNIGVEDLPFQTFTLEQYTELGINKLITSLQDVNITESTDSTLAGLPAHKINYTFTFIDEDNPSNQLPLKNMQVWTVKDGKAYIITYGGLVNQFSESLADAQKMINSFEILQSADVKNDKNSALSTEALGNNTTPKISAEAIIG